MSTFNLGAMNHSSHTNENAGFLGTAMSRRGAFGAFGALSAVALLAACGNDAKTVTSAPGSSNTATGVGSSNTASGAGPSDTASGAGPSDTAATAETAAAPIATSGVVATDGTCTEVPTETGGPYPADGSNGPNILSLDGVVRSDIRTSIGSASGVAAGVPLSTTLTVVDTANGCAPLAGAAIYLWHCNIDGAYSMYSQGVTNENYLRGVQETDANGQVTFLSIFPAAYSGRWPHIHFEVYESLTGATSGGKVLVTSQLALPEDVCSTVFASAGYESSVQNMAQTSLSTDNVFSDDEGVHQIPAINGDVSAGYAAALTVGV